MLSCSSLRLAAAVARRSAAAAPSSRCFAVSSANGGGHVSINEIAEGREYTNPKIGDREIVGFGATGNENYFDRRDFPYPALRWKSPKAPGVPELREKELGDWKNLTLDEKKALYRASFCQTYAEFVLNDKGQWKLWIGGVLIGLAFSLWLWFFCKLFVYKPLPDTFSPEGQLARLRYEIAIRKDPIQGISSKWDYEKDQWKE